MKRTEAFLIAGVLATTMLSWPSPAQDVYASVGAADAGVRDEPRPDGAVEPVISATDRYDDGARGNPLWSVPLSALAEIRERPLFSSSRRPPPIAPPLGAPSPAVEQAAPQTKTAQEPPPWALIGTIVGPAASVAIVQNSGTQAVSRIRLGDEESGWRVRSVAARSIMVEKGAETVTLELPRPSAKDGPPAPEKEQADGKRPSH